MTCEDYLVHPELCFPGKSLLLLGLCMISFFSQNTQLWRSIFSLLLYKSKWFLLTVRWFESHYCLLSKSIDSTNHLTLKFHGEVKHFDSLVSRQHLKMQLLGFLLHLISLWIYLSDVETNFQPKLGLSDLIQDQMCLELSLKFWPTCFYSTGRRKNYSPCFLVPLELSSFYSLNFFMFWLWGKGAQPNHPSKLWSKHVLLHFYKAFEGTSLFN